MRGAGVRLSKRGVAKEEAGGGRENARGMCREYLRQWRLGIAATRSCCPRARRPSR